MKKQIHNLIRLLLSLMVISVSITACKKEYKPEESFLKVYDDKDGSKNYFPLSIQQTTDQGYVILSAYNGWNIHVVKTSEKGDLLWEFDLPSQYVNAVPNFIQREGKLHFVCMDAVGLFTYIMQVDEANKTVIQINDFQNINYPLAVTDNQETVFIQNYQRSSYRTGIHKLNSSMDQILNSESVNIFTNVEDKIVDHINYTGKRFPFFVRVTPEKNHILLGGFNNYSFSTVFLNSDLDFTGVYNGAAFNGGLNSILPLGSNQFALARFSFSNVFINPTATLSPTVVDIAESIPAQGLAELDADSPVLIKNVNITGSEYLVYLATTKSNQLLLNFYGKGSSTIQGSKYLGQSVPLKASEAVKTADGGLMILTRVTVMGSFNRIATIKLSKEELEKIVE